MDLLYANLILFLTLIEDLESAFQTKAVINSFADEIVLFESDEPSLLQCAQRCRFIDKSAIIDFKGSKCTCLKYDTDEGQEQIGTLAGVFINQKVMKMKPKPKPTCVMAKDGGCCVFPFQFRGKWHVKCIDFGAGYFCATDVGVSARLVRCAKPPN